MQVAMEDETLIPAEERCESEYGRSGKGYVTRRCLSPLLRHLLRPYSTLHARTPTFHMLSNRRQEHKGVLVLPT